MEFERNGVRYARDIDHCDPSPYVRMVTIKKISPAANSDRLDKIEFEELGWNAISQKGLHEEGSKVMFIPAESVLPADLSEELDITKYLSKGRVRVAKFRGNRSEGLIVRPDIIEKWVPHIMKWEDKPTLHMQGDGLSLSLVSPHFHTFYKMPNILNEPDTFEVGEKIYYSEKIHGTNLRFGRLPHPETEESTLYVGSHKTVLKESDTNIYWKMVREHMADKLVDNIEYFAEIFGRGVQDLHYDRREPDIRVFAASRNGYYMNPSALNILCEKTGVSVVDFKLLRFESVEQVRELSSMSSVYTNSHLREGIVLVSADRPERMAKCLSFEYLARKNKKERH